jgi:single-stranded-DNA-specific exonuclease
VGLTVERRLLSALHGDLVRAAAGWSPELLRPTFEIEIDLAPREVTSALLAELARLEPHGPGNPQPLVRVGPLRLAAQPRRFGRDHLSARCRGEDGAAVSLIGWGWAARPESLAGRFEALGYLEEDAYRGGPVLRLADARPAP